MSNSNLEILAYESTPLGTLCLRRRELLASPGTVVTEVTLNHEFLMSSLYTDSEEALTRTALELHHGSELRVLIGGLGLGYTAHEALQSSHVAYVEVVELLPPVIDWLNTGLIPLAPALKPDLHATRRLVIREGDIYEQLAAPATERWDVILIDVDHAPDERLAEESISFYSEEGITRAQQHLAPGGVLGVWSYAESSPFAEALRNVFRQVHVTPVAYENRLVDEQRTDWLFFAGDQLAGG